MKRCARSPRTVRPWKVEQLETREAPAILSFRAGVGTAIVEDVSIAAGTPDIALSSAFQLDVAGPDSASLQRQSLLKFDQIIGNGANQIPPNATVVHANLVFWATDGSMIEAPIEVRRLLIPWSASNSTWASWQDGVQANGVEANAAADMSIGLGSSGYQVGGQNLKNTIQQWVNGQANNGWVITIGNDQESWSIASSDHPDIDKRPCLSVEFTAPGYTNPSYSELAGVPPLATTLAWFDWDNDLRNRRVARVPLERATTFYFSQSGDDVNGLGTIEQPWKSLAKARDVLFDSGGQGMRLRFRRGDVWRESTDFTLVTYISGFTMDDYGDPTLAKPVFSRFLALPSSDWEQVNASMYKIENPSSVGWIREAADGYSRLYYRAASSAEVTGRARSWYYDDTGVDPNSFGVPTLFLNCGDNPALVPGGFETCPDDGLGWVMLGDNIRLQNLRIEGHGIAPHGQSYGLAIGQAGPRREFVGIGLEVYYTGYHAIGQIIQYAGSKGAVTLIDCSAGLCVNRDSEGDPNNGDITVYVAYGDFGGNEFISYNCEAKYGTLPSADWGAVPGKRHGSAFLCHVGQGGYLDLVIVEKTRTVDCENPLIFRNILGNVRQATTLADVRGYIVEDGPGNPKSVYIGSPAAIINCVFDYSNPTPEFDYHYSFSYNQFSIGWLINCTIKIDATNQNSYYFLLMHSVSGNGVQAIHCHIDIYNAPRPLYWDVPFSNGPDMSYARISNSIISFSTSASTGLGVINNAEQLQHNAYYLPNLETSLWGYSGDTGAVSLSQRYPVGLRPTPSSPLYDGGLDGLVEYDQQRQPRGSINTIGPLNGVPLPAPTAVKALWGERNSLLEPNTRLWSAGTNRIQVEFPYDVDLRINALQLYDTMDLIPWSNFSYDPATRIAEWTLATPLPKGHYTLELDAQPLLAFSVLPGDFNGDGVVGSADFNIFRLNYGTTNFVGDLDGDGHVNALDFQIFRLAYGTMF